MGNSYKKDFLGFQDIAFDTDGLAATFARETSTGSSQNINKFNAAHLPLLLATRTLEMYNSGTLSASDVDTAVTNICANLASIPVFSNKAVLDAIQSAGSGAIMTTSERSKLNSIIDLGSGQIITAQERAKLAGLTALTEDELEIVGQIASLFPVGIVIAFPTSSLPSSFLECDGSALNRVTYSDLYGVIGTKYGNTDSTDFYLPDYRGEFLRGWDHGAGSDPDAGSRTDRGDGTAGDNVGTKQTDQLKSHNHNISRYNAGGSTNYVPTPESSSTSSKINTSSTGGNETRPINTNVMYCIRYQASA